MKMKNFLQRSLWIGLLFFVGIGGLSAQTWQLVTSASQLVAGDQVVIAALDSNRALSTTQTNNNRSAVAITKDNDFLTINDDVQILTLVAGIVENTWAFYTGDGYLCAASSSKNYLRTEEELSGNSSFALSISASGDAEMRAQGDFTRNMVRYNYNTGTPIFSCYASGQKAVALYKNISTESQVAAPTFSPAAGRYSTPQMITLSCVTENANIYYTLDGTRPDSTSTLYSAPFEINETTTVKAIAMLDGAYSNLSTATYTFPTVVENIAALREQEVGSSVYVLAGNAFVTFTSIDRNAKYIQDSTAGILIDDVSGILTQTYHIGDEITGLAGTLTNFNGMLEFIPTVDIPAAVTTANEIDPVDIDLSDMSAYLAQLVRVSNVVIENAGDTFAVATHYALNGQSHPDLYTKYSDVDYLGANIPAGAQNIVGVVMVYNNTYSIVPRSLADFEANTDECAAVATLANCQVETATHNTIELSATVESNGGAGCALTAYGFVYSIDNTTPNLSDSNCTVVNLGEMIAEGTPFTTNISGVVADSLYVCAYATNGAGTAYSEVLVARFAEPLTHTITYSVNGSTSRLEADVYAEGDDALVLPVVTGCGNWTFLGWSTDEMNSTALAAAPAVLTTLAPTENTTLYAVFAMNDGEETDGTYTKVTSNLDDWTGTYLLAYEPEETDTMKFFTGVDAGRNFVAAATTDGVLPAIMEGMTELFVAPMEGGYYFQVLNGDNAGKYMCGASGSNKLNFNASEQLNTFVFNADSANFGTITITSNTSILRFNKNSGANNERFRYYQSSNVSYPLVALYKKSGGNMIYSTTIPDDTTFLAVTICDGDVYTEHGFNVSEAGVYTNVVASDSSVCIDVYQLTLNVVTPVYGQQDTVTECTLYTWDVNGTTYYESGDYEEHILSTTGCDSIINTLHLTINNGEMFTENALDTCLEAGETYTWSWRDAQVVCDHSDTYVLNSLNANGCMDTAVRVITINRIRHTDIEATICSSETYTENGFNVNEEGVYTQTLSTADGCDSIVTLTLHLGSAHITNVQDEICSDNAYSGFGFEIPESELTEAGVYIFSDTIIREGNCDSIVNLALTVKATSYNDVNAVACESYTWNDSIYTESGVYTMTFMAENGCDSIVNLTLTINQPVETSLTESACESYTWNDTTYTESGVYTMTFTAENGCDSIVTLNLTVDTMPVVNIEGNLEIAAGESTTLAVTENENWTYVWNTEETSAVITVTPVETTSYTVTVTNGACSVTDSAMVSVTTGLNDNQLSIHRIFPNPADQYCTIEADAMQEINVFNMNGQRVGSYRVDANSYRLETASLCQGTYFIQVISADRLVLTGKLVVKHE